ncbi:MAG: hypothetical protein ACR2LR_15400 [Hassallia sp.]
MLQAVRSVIFPKKSKKYAIAHSSIQTYQRYITGHNIIAANNSQVSVC